MIFLPVRSQLSECLIHRMHLKLCLRIGSIYHMNDIICILSLFQRTFKRFYQMMWQLADKSYSICQKDLLPIFEFQYTRRRIQCCEQLIFCQNAGSCQCIKSVDFPAFV